MLCGFDSPERIRQYKENFAVLGGFYSPERIKPYLMGDSGVKSLSPKKIGNQGQQKSKFISLKNCFSCATFTEFNSSLSNNCDYILLE